MSLLRKSFILIVLGFVLMISALYAVSRTVVLRSFSDVENQDIRQEINRAQDALQSEINQLNVITGDYSAWDETYAYIENPDPQYLSANLNDEALANLHLNLVLFLNSSGKTVAVLAFQPGSKHQASMPEGLARYLTPGSRLLNHTTPQDAAAGIVMLPDGPLMLASRPIVTGDYQGPIRGTLIMGRYLDQDELKKIAAQTHQTLTLQRLDRPALSPDFQLAQKSVTPQSPIFVSPLEDQMVGGYYLFQDVAAQPALILRVDKPRTIYQKGQSTLSYFLVWMIILGVLSGGATQTVVGFLIRSQNKQQASEAHFQLLADNSTDMIARQSLEGLLLYVSPASLQVLGYSPEAMIGHSINEFLPPGDIAENDKIRALLCENEEVTTITHKMVCKCGDEIWLETTARHIHDPKTNELIEIHSSSRDITERLNRQRSVEVINRISLALRSTLTRAEVFSVLLPQLADLFQTADIAIILKSLHSNSSRIACVSGNFEGWANTDVPSDNPFIQNLLEKGQVVIDNQAQDTLRRAQVDSPIRSRALASVPIIVNAISMGFILIGREAQFSKVDVQLLTALADFTAGAVHRADLHEETQSRLERLKALHRIDLAIAAKLSMVDTLKILLDQVIVQLQIDAADILLLNEKTGGLDFAAGSGFVTEALRHTHLKPGEGLAGKVLLENRIVQVSDLSTEMNGLKRSPLFVHEGFLTYLGVPLKAKDRLMGVLEVFHRESLDPDGEWLSFLETLAGQAAIGIENTSLFLGLKLAYDATIEGWSHALDLRDHETQGHSSRVTELTLRLAEAMGVPEGEMEHIRRGALLHDIGKMGIPDAILLKPGSFTDEEWVIMRKHPGYAYEMLSQIDYLLPALDIPYCHHEKWDGSGYPRGLHGEEIPLAARIFAIVDVWDALTSDRVYRPAWPKERALDHIRSQSGKHFDPRVVETFLQVMTAQPLESSAAQRHSLI